MQRSDFEIQIDMCLFGAGLCGVWSGITACAIRLAGTRIEAATDFVS